MRTAINVHLPPPAINALRDLACREYRDPRDQAAVMLLDGLRRAGSLISETEQTDACARLGRCVRPLKPGSKETLIKDWPRTPLRSRTRSGPGGCAGQMPISAAPATASWFWTRI